MPPEPQILFTISELPSNPAVYALYGGRGNEKDVAYVGIARNLKQRIFQHLVRRDSSVTTGVSVASLNAEHVTKVRWWEHSDFSNNIALMAAELVAFNVLNPVLRSRGRTTDEANEYLNTPGFKREMKRFFKDGNSGEYLVPTLKVAIERIIDLEERVKRLEGNL